MRFSKGDLVENTKAPGWGVGEVIDNSIEYVHVVFENVDLRKAFIRGDNPLKKVGHIEDEGNLRKNLRRKLYGGLSTDERVKRDGKNAEMAKNLAEEEIRNFYKVTYKPDITGSLIDFSQFSDAYKAIYYANLDSIFQKPFHAMVEVRTNIFQEDGQKVGNQLWYVNERIKLNMPLGKDNSRVNVLPWTHPGVQLALVGDLGEFQDIRSLGYILHEVAPIARARFTEVLPKISGLYDPGGRVGREQHKSPVTGLKAVKTDMTKDQVMAFISKMNGMMLVSGAPGSGKTTVGMQRIRFLYDQQEIRKDDLKNVSYSPELTRIFLANQNLIDSSKEMLENDLQIPSGIVELVNRFVKNYLDDIWAFKYNARPRRKKLFVYDKRGRQAFFGLCNSAQLKNCWLSFEYQISERLAQARKAKWLNNSKHQSNEPPRGKQRGIRKLFKSILPQQAAGNLTQKKFKKQSESLADALAIYSKKKASPIPTTSPFRMDLVYNFVGKKYEELRQIYRVEGGLEEFDRQFQQWLYWVYDPFDGIMSYFQDQFYEGGVRIKNGIAAKISENEILSNIREDWNERIYGEEEEPWLAFLLRFALPTQSNPQERFREIPNPLAVAEHGGENWTHVMVDEAQDLCVAEAALLSSFVHPDGALTVAADFRQVVSPVWGMENPEAFRIGSSLRDKESYQSYPFSKNLRQSKQIGLFLQSFYHSIFRQLPPFEYNETIEGPEQYILLLVAAFRRYVWSSGVAGRRRLPEHASFAEGAAFQLVFLTAYIPLTRQVRVCGRARPCSSTRRAGGVGTAAIQIARRARGARRRRRGLGGEARPLPRARRRGGLRLRRAARRPAQSTSSSTRSAASSSPSSFARLRPLGTVLAIGSAAGAWTEVDPARLVGRNAGVQGFYLGRLMRYDPGAVVEALGELLDLWRTGAVHPVVGAELPARRGRGRARARRVAPEHRQGGAAAVRALVTGGRGGIGSAIVAALHDREGGAEVTVLDLPDFDVGDPAAWRALEGSVRRRLPQRGHRHRLPATSPSCPTASTCGSSART